jgi:uncharacterized membrane protein
MINSSRIKRTFEKVLQIMFWCHRKPERSFFFRGKQFPICARCTGIFAGYFTGISLLILWQKLPVWAVILCMLPMIADGLIQNTLHIMSSNPRRFITGIIFGTALIHAIAWIERGLAWIAFKLVIGVMDMLAITPNF